MTPYPSDAPTTLRWRQIFVHISPRMGAWIISISLALVLICLTSFAIWSAITTRNAATYVSQTSEISDLYQQARFAVAAEESLERKYRLEPAPEIAARHQAAADALVKALTAVRTHDDVAARGFVVDMLTAHSRYLEATHRMFVEVDAGHTAQVLAIDSNDVDPVFDAIETQINQAAEDHYEQVLQALSQLEQQETLVFLATPVVFTIGLILLSFFWGMLRALQGRLEVAVQLEAQREIERIKSNAELGAALMATRAKSMFLATMSHELRTPLTAILGYTELMKLEVNDCRYEGLAGDIEHILTSGDHLLSLINDVLDLSKVEAGKLVLDIRAFNLRELIDDLVATMQPLVAKNGNRLRLEVAQDLGTMDTDSTKLRQVLLNLLSNAAKFTQRGMIVLRVEQDQRLDGTWICFSVSDTGIGMRTDQLQSLFQPFMQADASTARNYGGTGLGLALCKQLCMLLGGQITVTSTLGVGSTFDVTLPVFMSELQRKSVAEMAQFTTEAEI